MRLNETIKYYNDNAKGFIEDTIRVDMGFSRNRFLNYIRKEGHILDFGCGSGRDSREFMNLEYKVSAIDGSKSICEITSEYLGIDVKCLEFSEFNDVDKYDGIWACASILHLNSKELEGIFKKMKIALRKDGVIYVSFKLGDFEGIRKGRYFNYMNQDRLERLIGDLRIIDTWITCDGRLHRNTEKWFNAILK